MCVYVSGTTVDGPSLVRAFNNSVTIDVNNHGSQLRIFTSKEYFTFLLEQANTKMKENEAQWNRFFTALRSKVQQ